MNLLARLFRKKEELTPAQRVRGIMQHFVEASHVGLDPQRWQTPDHGQVYLLYMLGALDILAQTHHLDGKDTLTMFTNLLENELGGYTPDEAQQITQGIARASADASNQKLMKEGAEAVSMWIGGAALAPHRLEEILMGLG